MFFFMCFLKGYKIIKNIFNGIYYIFNSENIYNVYVKYVGFYVYRCGILVLCLFFYLLYVLLECYKVCIL